MGSEGKDRAKHRTPGTRRPTGTPDPGTPTPYGHDDARDAVDQHPEEGTTAREQGDQTRPAQPAGTRPLERDQWPINQKR